MREKLTDDLSLVVLAIMLIFSCSKELEPEFPEVELPKTEFEWEYHYQVNDLELPAEFVLSYLDSSLIRRTVIKNRTDCSLLYKWQSARQSMYLSVETDQDVKVVLWICKDDTVVYSCSGMRNAYINLK